ncbi:cupin domain-containing protein [Jannaschia sp. Os4]|uniref:ChrR family anti-sigma-E factor n=1 Tax=Jannaschia sp. Os4 TaxID=2807617 RepID=UPI0019396F52|nr:ChrR family anti-sigma-E factor [Jannaschia sp. Os4]MBM2575025.1 cupin domain-containing protein [Jannaschia sp. Os4]
MSVTHEIDDRLLMGYAAGLLPEAYDLLVATAVSLDDEARARLEGFEALGGALLSEQPVAPLREGSFEEVMARINGTVPEDTVHPDVRTPRTDPVLPQPLRDALGGDLEDVRWQSIGLGSRQAIVPTWAEEGASVRLMHIPAGQAMPEHGHDGAEYVLVLKGSIEDRGMTFRRGDLSHADGTVEHTPTAGPGEDCVCLALTDAPLLLKGLLPRIAQRFLDI